MFFEIVRGRVYVFAEVADSILAFPIRTEYERCGDVVSAVLECSGRRAKTWHHHLRGDDSR